MQWGHLHRFGFRFLFAYLALYTTNLFGLSRWIVPWFSSLTTGQTLNPWEMNGSGDMLFHWLQALCTLVGAALTAIIWSAADHRRPHYRTLHAWLHTWLRYCLGLTLIGYGMGKIIQTQFPHPDPYSLSRTYGESSPMGLLWTFMGFSAGYNFFTGLAEVVPGVLLFFRRTALLGALLAAAVMTNIVALNFFYDVPVKLFSTHLLLISLVIAAPDFPRLARVFLFNEPTPAAELRPALDDRPRLVHAWQFVKAILIALLIGLLAYQMIRLQNEFKTRTSASRLHGVYEVEDFSHEGKQRWIEVSFGRGDMRAGTRSGDQLRYQYSAGERRLTLIHPDGVRADLEIRQPQPNILELKGPLAGAALNVRLRKRSTGFLLEDRGFHWVNETPFNR